MLSVFLSDNVAWLSGTCWYCLPNLQDGHGQNFFTLPCSRVQAAKINKCGPASNLSQTFRPPETFRNPGLGWLHISTAQRRGEGRRMRCSALSTEVPPVTCGPSCPHGLWMLTDGPGEPLLLAAQGTACPQGCPLLQLCTNAGAQPPELVLQHLNPWCIPRASVCSHAAALCNFPFLCPCIHEFSL